MIDLAELRNKEGGALDKVLYAATGLAHARLNPDPADPGFDVDLYEDILRDAAIEYADVIRDRRIAEGKGVTK